MNLLIYEAHELNAEGLLELEGRRLTHLREVLNAQSDDTLRVGELHGRCGSGRILSIDATRATIELELSAPPPEPLGLTVVLALPRPKMLRRILRTLAEVGVKDVHLIHTYRVEKSFWQSPLLDHESLRTTLVSGLEQAKDTVLPDVHLHRRFRPFAEDLLPTLCEGKEALLADPGASTAYPPSPGSPALLLVGPEGGFIPFETQLMIAAGATAVSLGPRTLRTETALISALGKHLRPPL